MLKAYIKDDFNNLLEYQQWVKHSMGNISTLNRKYLPFFSQKNIQRTIESDPAWFGKGTTYAQLQAGITSYKDPQLIERMYNQVTASVTPLLKDKIKVKKVEYNAMGLGVFLFDRAAMGMYRLTELFSPSLNRTVDRSAVKKVKKGYELLADGSPVIERPEQKPDGSPKIRTTSKNIYAYFPKRDKEKRAVEIYLSCGGSAGVQAADFLYSGISAIIVGQLLEQARISTKISIVIGTSPDNFKRSVYACIVPVKNYDEGLDTNLLALLSSDPRFYRYDGFKGIYSVYDHFGKTVPGDIGYGFNKRENLVKTIEQSTYTAIAKLAPNRIYMGRIFSEGEAINDITTTMNTLTEQLNRV